MPKFHWKDIAGLSIIVALGWLLFSLPALIRSLARWL